MRQTLWHLVPLTLYYFGSGAFATAASSPASLGQVPRDHPRLVRRSTAELAGVLQRRGSDDEKKYNHEGQQHGGLNIIRGFQTASASPKEGTSGPSMPGMMFGPLSSRDHSIDGDYSQGRSVPRVGDVAKDQQQSAEASSASSKAKDSWRLFKSYFGSQGKKGPGRRTNELEDTAHGADDLKGEDLEAPNPDQIVGADHRPLLVRLATNAFFEHDLHHLQSYLGKVRHKYPGGKVEEKAITKAHLPQTIPPDTYHKSELRELEQELRNNEEELGEAEKEQRHRRGDETKLRKARVNLRRTKHELLETQQELRQTNEDQLREGVKEELRKDAQQRFNQLFRIDAKGRLVLVGRKWQKAAELHQTNRFQVRNFAKAAAFADKKVEYQTITSPNPDMPVLMTANWNGEKVKQPEDKHFDLKKLQAWEVANRAATSWAQLGYPVDMAGMDPKKAQAPFPHFSWRPQWSHSTHQTAKN